MSFFPGWWWLLPGLFAQGGIAQEVLFRGYLFGRIRRGRSFWHFVCQATVKVVAFPDTAVFPLVWMLAGAVIPLAVLLVPRRT